MVVYLLIYRAWNKSDALCDLPMCQTQVIIIYYEPLIDHDADINDFRLAV